MMAMAILVISAMVNLMWFKPEMANASNLAFLIACLALIAGIAYLAERREVQMQMTPKNIKIKYTNWRRVKEKIKLNKIDSFEIVSGLRFSKYSGWTVAFGADSTPVVPSGPSGIKLYLRSGESVVLSTKRPERFAQHLVSCGIEQI